MKNKKELAYLLIIFLWFLFSKCQPYTPVNSNFSVTGKNSVNRQKIPSREVNGISSGLKKIMPEYEIAVGDVIEVKFFYQGELNEIVTVRPDGRITLQRVGSIYVLGMRPSHLQEIIQKKYAEIINDPEVTVFIRKYSDLRVYVMGEVQNPGGQVWQPNLTIVRSIAEAGGFKKEAKYSSILLLRLHNNRIYAHRVNLEDLYRGQKLPRDIRLRPNDVVFVPAKFITHVKEFITNFYDLVLPPLDMYYRALILDRWN